MEFYILIGFLAVIVIYILITYNRLVSLSNKTKEAFSTMDVYLKKRWDLIPNIVEAVKGYATHEKQTLESVVNLRSSSYDDMSLEDKVNTNMKLKDGITKLMMIAESYPELKASENFLNLSNELSNTENDIANSRKYYNAVVRRYIDKTEMFPSNIISSLFGFKNKKMFEINNLERESVKVEL